jgi:histidinol-phosphate aminotransferase
MKKSIKLNPRMIGKAQYTLPITETYLHKLDICESQFEHSPIVLNAINNCNSHLCNTYPHGNAKLIQNISEYCGVNVDQIILTNGSDNALGAICTSYIVPDTSVLIPLPTYPHFLSFTKTLTNNINYVNINLEDCRSGVLKIDKITCGITDDTNLCYIVSPNLPLGYVVELDEIEAALQKYPSVMFVIDEAYVEFGGKTATKLLNYDNIIITRTFSKAFGLAGLRLGYLLSKKSNIDYIKSIINDKAVTNTAMNAANAAFEDLQYYKSIVDRIEAEKIRIRREFDTIIHKSAMIYDTSVTHGYFYLIFSKTPAKVCEIFAEHGIYIRDKSSDTPDAIRISLGREDQNSDVLDVIRKINFQYLLRSHKVIFDLDNTIRPTSKNSMPAYNCAKLINSCDSYICSNNSTYTPQVINSYLSKYGINISTDRIFTPLTMFVSLVLRENLRFAVLGSPDVVNYFSNVAGFVDFNIATQETVDVVFLPNAYFIDVHKVIKICKLKKPLYYVSLDSLVALVDDSDVEEISDVEIPGPMLVANLFKHIVPIVPICKSIAEFVPTELATGNSIMIGDSLKTDKFFAAHINAVFCHIGKTPNTPMKPLMISFENIEQIVL